VWVGEIKDRPGGLGQKLEALADAGANLEFVISRRAPEKRGKGVVFLAPLRGAKQTAAAKKAKLKRAGTLHSLRLEGPDRAGLGARITEAIREAEINMRGLSAAALGKRMVCYLAFDSAADATKARAALTKALKRK
jgi:hypothetical protein